jgi:hypothetical protein
MRVESREVGVLACSQKKKKSFLIFEEGGVDMFKKLIVFCLALVVVGLILPVGANACPVSITVTATNEAGSDVAILGGDASLDGSTGNYVWVLDSEVPILDGAIETLKLTVAEDPEVGVEFGVRAGNSAMTFSFFDVITFDSLVNPTAEASAAITLTDRGGGGATITGLFGGKTHEATYNGSTVFADLVSGFSGGGSSTASETTGSGSISGTVSSIEAEFYFTLSAKDAASGTSTFEVTPEPATVALLGLGGLALLRRKRAN